MSKLAPAPPCVVIQDTREPSLESGDREDALFAPAVWRQGQRHELQVERRKLGAGDYSLHGLEHMVAFERKTLGDLISTLVGSTTDSVGERAGNLERFRAELERLRAYPYARIIVEGSLRDLYRALEGRRVQPVAVVHLLLSIDVDYQIPTLWAGDRRGAELVIGYALSRIWEQHCGGESWRKAEARGYAAELPWGPPGELARYRGEAAPVAETSQARLERATGVGPGDVHHFVEAPRIQLPPHTSYQRRKVAPGRGAR